MMSPMGSDPSTKINPDKQNQRLGWLVKAGGNSSENMSGNKFKRWDFQRLVLVG